MHGEETGKDLRLQGQGEEVENGEEKNNPGNPGHVGPEKHAGDNEPPPDGKTHEDRQEEDDPPHHLPRPGRYAQREHLGNVGELSRILDSFQRRL